MKSIKRKFLLASVGIGLFLIGGIVSVIALSVHVKQPVPADKTSREYAIQEMMTDVRGINLLIIACGHSETDSSINTDDINNALVQDIKSHFYKGILFSVDAVTTPKIIYDKCDDWSVSHEGIRRQLASNGYLNFIVQIKPIQGASSDQRIVAKTVYKSGQNNDEYLYQRQETYQVVNFSDQNEIKNMLDSWVKWGNWTIAY